MEVNIKDNIEMYVCTDPEFAAVFPPHFFVKIFKYYKDRKELYAIKKVIYGNTELTEEENLDAVKNYVIKLKRAELRYGGAEEVLEDTSESIKKRSYSNFYRGYIDTDKRVRLRFEKNYEYEED
jgi:hypothetical protein